MRLCLGHLDPLTETFDYSPAWMTHACADFRVSIPCKMSARPSYVNAVISADDNDVLPSLQDLCGAAYRPLSALPPVPSQQHAAAPASLQPPPQPKAKKAKQPSALKRASVAAKVAATLAPGFPQSNTFPSKEEFRLHRAQLAGRKVQDGQAASVPDASVHTPDNPGNVINPIGVTYAVSDLKQSGRLMDGVKLDLPGSNLLTQAELQRQLAKFKREILAEMRAAASLPASPPPPVPVAKPVTARKPQPAAASLAAAPPAAPAPVSTLEEFPPLQPAADASRRPPRSSGGITRVPDATPPTTTPVLSFACQWEVTEGYLGSEGIPLESAREQHAKTVKKSKARSVRHLWALVSCGPCCPR